MAKKAVLSVVSLLLIAVLLLGVVKVLEPSSDRKDPEHEPEFISKVITRDGVDYYPRQDITVVLMLGVDRMGIVESSGSYNNTASADLVVLLIFDEKNETYSVLQLNRDTMLTMPALGLGGKPAGTRYGQLALSHTYGSGLEDSCENTKKTVSDFLYGLNIDYYVSLNMGAMPTLNDAVGGVTVHVQEDFSDVDPTIMMGEITLRGEQALNYVRVRKDVGDQKNITRMDRHAAYMEGFVRAFRERAEENSNFVLNIYEEISPYLVTDCSVNTISGMLQRYSEYQLGEIVTPKGENVLGNKYYEFYVDEQDLDEQILKLFYSPK